MANFFIDTNIIVDNLRNYSPGVAWKNAQGKALVGITPITWMEVVWGARDKIAQQKAVRFLLQFEMVDLTHTDMAWAMTQLEAYRLSHNVDILDCLIAAPSHRLQLPLYTRNLKHFGPRLGALPIQPY